MAKILVVDDESSVLQSMGVLLGSEGHEVVPVRDSGKAAELLRTEDYDLLMTDIRMSPVDGMELIKIAHEKNPAMPSIVISAYGSESTEKMALGLGCAAYLQKPFKIQEVLAAVRQALQKK
jgi:DNA-binding NtrC family response regulator